MSFISIRNLVKLPVVVESSRIDDENFEDVSMSMNRGGVTRNHNLFRKPSVSSPSPLKKMLLNRSSSISSTSSNKSSNSQEGSSYIVCVNKTPLNLTPSQRLKLRKAQLTNSISKFKEHPQQRDLSQQHQQGPEYGEDDEDDVDDNICMFNVPLSQSLTSISQREKYIYTNNDRKLSLTTDSTRSSSIISHTSFTDSSSMTSFEDEARQSSLNLSKIRQQALHDNRNFETEGTRCNRPRRGAGGAATTTSSTSTNAASEGHSTEQNSHTGVKTNNGPVNIEDLKLSKDAERLTLLFNQNDYVQINEVSSQRKKLLSSFKRINGMEDGLLLLEHEREIQSDKRKQQGRSISSQASNFPKLSSNGIRSFSNPISPSKSSLQMIGPGGTTSKYFSFTRPTWLPPKSSSDIQKHQMESVILINRALAKETEAKNKKLAKLELLKQQKQKDLNIWRDQVLPDGCTILEKDYQRLVLSDMVKDMYWRGIPSKSLRSSIWDRQIGNKLQLTDHTCSYYFDKVKNFKLKIAEYGQIKRTKNNKPIMDSFVKNNPKILHMRAYYDKLSNDLLDTFPDLNYFQNFETISKLIDIVTAFLIFVNETNQGIEVNEEKFENLNLNYYFTGLNNITAIFFYHYNRDTYMTFITLCNLFQSQLLNLLLAHHAYKNKSDKSDFGLTLDQMDLLTSSLNENFFNSFEKKLSTSSLNRVSIHFKIINLSPIEYLPNMILGIFSNFLDFTTSCHILDIFTFEHDSFLLDCSAGLMLQISCKLFGTKDETLKLFNENYRQVLNITTNENKPELYKYLNVGLEYEFIEKIRMFNNLA